MASIQAYYSDLIDCRTLPPQSLSINLQLDHFQSGFTIFTCS